MACFKPLAGWRSATVSPNGRRPVVFTRSRAFVDLPVKVPCGQCIGCRLDRSRSWAVRCVHEAKSHEENSFITLTYSNEHVPGDNGLCFRDFQLFMKRFRKRVRIPIRFYHCGEYGENFGRPHYHALIFGYSFPDKVLWKYNNGQGLYRSAELEELWPYGYSSVGDVTFQSAAYVARYIVKKITGKIAEDHYKGRCPEYTTMSRKPGIGKKWIMKYLSDVYPLDEVILDGKTFKTPVFYDASYELMYPSEFEDLRLRRKRASLQHVDNQTQGRLDVREVVQKARLERLPRVLK